MPFFKVTVISHAEVFFCGKNQMILKWNFQHQRKIMNLAGQNQILVGGEHLLARVVVRHDKGTCVAENQNPENVAGMNHAIVGCAAKYHFFVNDFHLCIEA